jgi:succinate dehydrogenase / fumarate reductase flavoprotein subunit/fumarate reductase (CoM/CoB) subunit A
MAGSERQCSLPGTTFGARVRSKRKVNTDALHLQADVLVIGGGAAGLMAARAASAAGASVILVDKSIIGRGGATIMAQMTTAVALGAAEPDSPELHAADTLALSRELGDPALIEAICARGPEVIREVETYGAKWARTADGTYSQVFAPGHSVKRCVYVDVLRTGESVSQALRSAIRRDDGIARLSNVMLTKLAKDGERVTGALGFAIEELRPVAIAARTTIVATGGLTYLYARNSASSNMTGDGFALAAEAGATLRDMEMVQFFPIAHLYPPLVQLDPIMWDPFRYKLGGRLLNGLGEEFLEESGTAEGAYTTPRDTATYAIFREVEAGRGSPHGGAFLDFRMIPRAALEQGFGPVIDILGRQGIDLTRDMVEVSPMAHFMLGGIVVDPSMQTGVPGLLACGEAIGGMHGANRLSGNAITEALVTGRIAGETAARERGAIDPVDAQLRAEWDALQAFWHPRTVARDEASIDGFKVRLQRAMWDGAGPLRTGPQLKAAQAEITAIERETRDIALAPQREFALNLQEKVELRIMLAVAESIVLPAIARRESRGAHVRLDFPESDAATIARFLERRDGAWTMHERATVAAS